MEFKTELDNECAFHLKNETVCSPESITEKLKDFVVAVFDKQIKDENDALEILKKKYDCSSESCILNQYDIKKYINPKLIENALETYFKPIGPRMTTNWLSNFDIDAVLAQIQKKYEDKNFLHIPFQMRDFQEKNTELAQLDWQKEYENGFRTFGAVINTDYSSGKGIHWFAIFGDFLDDNKCFTIEYFNSSGELPLPEITEWMKKLKHALRLDKPIKDIIATRIENQADSFSCGPYSLYYIISRLDGVPFEWFRKNKIGDKNMILFRKYLFRDEM